jgi:hypothetical protein
MLLNLIQPILSRMIRSRTRKNLLAKENKIITFINAADHGGIGFYRK